MNPLSFRHFSVGIFGESTDHACKFLISEPSVIPSESTSLTVEEKCLLMLDYLLKDFSRPPNKDDRTLELISAFYDGFKDAHACGLTVMSCDLVNNSETPNLTVPAQTSFEISETPNLTVPAQTSFEIKDGREIAVSKLNTYFVDLMWKNFDIRLARDLFAQVVIKEGIYFLNSKNVNSPHAELFKIYRDLERIIDGMIVEISPGRYAVQLSKGGQDFIDTTIRFLKCSSYDEYIGFKEMVEFLARRGYSKDKINQLLSIRNHDFLNHPFVRVVLSSNADHLTLIINGNLNERALRKKITFEFITFHLPNHKPDSVKGIVNVALQRGIKVPLEIFIEQWLL